jgi:hypothetical protein
VCYFFMLRAGVAAAMTSQHHCWAREQLLGCTDLQSDAEPAAAGVQLTAGWSGTT